MEGIDFKYKYLKYKNKYLQLKGGLINHIDKSELARQKEDYTVSHRLKEYIKIYKLHKAGGRRTSYRNSLRYLTTVYA
jgi:hypothetical protein